MPWVVKDPTNILSPLIYLLPTGCTGATTLAQLTQILADINNVPQSDPGVAGALFLNGQIAGVSAGPTGVSLGPTGPIGLSGGVI